MMLLEKMIERAGIVQHDLYPRVALEHADEREIGLLISLLRHELEIADRLMVVNGKDKLDFRHYSVTSVSSVLKVRRQNEILSFWERKVNQNQGGKAARSW
jgi:hypothetical protein